MRFRSLALLPVLALVGCMQSAQKYVDEQQTTGSYSVLKGRLLEIRGLNATRWQDLTDGVAITVAAPGCTVRLRQGEDDNAKERTFQLAEGELLIHGHGADFLLKLLDAKAEPKKEEPKKEEPKKEEPKKEEPAKKEPAKKEPTKKEPTKKEEPKPDGE